MDDSTTRPDAGGQMSFLEHLDELRKRLMYSVVIIVVAFVVCFAFADDIYRFLSVPIVRALSEASRRTAPGGGITGQERIVGIGEIKEGDSGVYVFDRPTNIPPTVVVAGATVRAQVARDSEGKLGLFTTEPMFTNNAIVPTGYKLPLEFLETAIAGQNPDERMTITTVPGGFSLMVTVSLYSAIALSVPLLLWQIWIFISPALYRHERSYVTPFIGLSSISFVGGVAFAYYILFPPAARYLLGIGEGDFQLLLKADDYLDFIIIIMLAMGLIFQMPAISYVLSRIGIISAVLLVRSWKIALIVILLVAAIVSPTGDIPNLLLFAAPMTVLYVVSIFIAWLFGKKRTKTAEAA